MSAIEFHPDLRVPWHLPRSPVGPRRLPLIRMLSKLHKPYPGAKAVLAQAGPDVRVRVFRPAAATGRRPGLLWIHGGGTVLGNAAMEDPICRAFADHLGIIVASVDYRLAPEHPFPTPLEDCYTALRWFTNQRDVDPARIAVGGASAGGGLAAALTFLARERMKIQPVLQVLVYPMLDDRTTTRIDIDARRLRLWSQACNRFGWSSYLKSLAPGEGVPALAAPARQDDLSGLPPAWIGVGTHDLFHDESVAYAEHLREAGVPCELTVVPGAYHGFDRAEAKTPVAQAFFDGQVAALNQILNGKT